MKPSKLRVDVLEDRRVPASVVIAESTFDPQIFGQNLEDAHAGVVVGFGYAITAPNGAIVAEGGGGYARTPTDGELAFGSTNSMEIASAAKTITAAATVKILLDQGKDVSEPIGGYFPASWDVPDEVASLTFADLLGHTSGFNVRRVTYEDLKELVAAGPQGEQGAYDYDTTNYSLLRILIPYLLAVDNGAELNALPEDQKPQVLADCYFNYSVTEVLEPLGVIGAATGHSSDTPTLLYNFPDDGTEGYETPDQRLHGDVLHGRANKFGLHDAPTLNVVYDQIELTELRAGDGANHIAVDAAPWYNQVAVSGGGGADDIDVASTPSFAGPMRVDGGRGADTIRVSPVGKTLGALVSPLSVNGGTGAAGEVDRLLVSDALSGNFAPYTLSKTALSRPGSGGIQYVGLEQLSINLNNQHNVVAVTSTAAGTAVSIAGLGGNDTLTASNLASPVTFAGGLGPKDTVRLVGSGGNDTIRVQGNTMSIGTGSLTATVEQREVDGAGGTDRMILLGKAGTTESFVLRPSTAPHVGRVTRTPFGPVGYESVEAMTVEGNPGDLDTLQVNGQTQANVFGGGSHFDGFNINLAAEGTSADPYLVLHNGMGQTMLTLTDYRDVGTPKINGLLGADIFDVRMLPDGPQSRRVKLDGSGQPFGLKGDGIRVRYLKEGATATSVSSGPTSGKVTVNYGPLFFGVVYQDIEDVEMIPV